jgi:hypothetical protein
MAPSSSSTKRAARLAQKGKGKRVRFQGGTLFPMVMLAIVIIGVGLVVYARATVPAADASPPTVNDHWHAAYGFSLCDQPEMVLLDGNLETPGTTGYTDFVRTGVHSHDDGVIHWHAYTSAATGRNATLGVFLENYGIELSDTTLKFPEDQNGGKEYVEGETKCPDGEDGELSVTVWSSPEDTSDGNRYVTGFDDIKINKNSLVITIAFQPKGTDIEMPPQAAQLEELGALDTNQVGAAPTTTVAGATTTTTADAATGSTVSGATPTTDAATDASTTTTAAATTTTLG